jgi:hypothetical protein
MYVACIEQTSKQVECLTINRMSMCSAEDIRPGCVDCYVNDKRSFVERLFGAMIQNFSFMIRVTRNRSLFLIKLKSSQNGLTQKVSGSMGSRTEM